MGLAGFITRNIMLGCLAIITIKWMLHFVVTTLTMGIKGKVTMKQMKWELFSKHESIGNLSAYKAVGFRRLERKGRVRDMTQRMEKQNSYPSTLSSPVPHSSSRFSAIDASLSRHYTLSRSNLLITHLRLPRLSELLE